MLQTYRFSLVSRAPANSWCSILTLESRMNFTNRVSLAELTILPSTSKSHAPIPPSPQVYPGRGNFSLISLQNPTNRLQEDREPDLAVRQFRWAS